MKLVIGVVQGEAAQRTVEALTPAGISSTRVEPGEFLAAFPVEVQAGGATVYVVPVDSFEKT